MSDVVQVRVHKSLTEVLENIRKNVAGDLKKKYNLTDVTVHGTLASQILAAKRQGKTCLNFKIKKRGLNKGVLELL